jgi:methylamine---glutamate N-methyltransferase subunit C
MAKYECKLCAHVYDADAEGLAWAELGEDWQCPVCGSSKELFDGSEKAAEADNVQPLQSGEGDEEYLKQFKRPSDATETQMNTIHQMAESGESVIEPMRTQEPAISWDELLIAKILK